MQYVPIIGLEVHIQLKTASKMFSSAPNTAATQPNTTIDPVVLAHPGTLPVPNKAAIMAGLRFAHAIKATIQPHTKFDRKNYFYPDLPKGYQVSQFDVPIAEGGSLVIDVDGENERGEVRIGITRIHLEEDAGKNIHDPSGKTFIDYNRAGVPLIEMVSEPDLRSPAEAKAYLQEVRLIARTLGVSDADMEKGHLRCDANISLRRVNEDGTIEGPDFNPKTEIKNLNSFRMVERAIAHEITRQTEMWEADEGPQETTTRGWDDAKGVTVPQRTKEDAAEYRYFPEPDIPFLNLTELAKEAKQGIPELPANKRVRFIDEYGLTKEDAASLVAQLDLANFSEKVFSELLAWVHALPEYNGMSGEDQKAEALRVTRTTGSWLMNNWVGILNQHKTTIAAAPVTAENFAELMKLVLQKDVTAKNATHILEVMTKDGKDPSHIMEDEGLGRMEDAGALAEAVLNTLESHPGEVERYLAGEEKILKFLMGMIMKKTEGRADPGIVMNMLKVELEEKRNA